MFLESIIPYYGLNFMVSHDRSVKPSEVGPLHIYPLYDVVTSLHNTIIFHILVYSIRFCLYFGLRKYQPAK